MTATERARRSDALYYETVSVTRRVLCDMIANREADLEELRAENRGLRESVKRLMTQRDERLARAEADNDRLRELVRDMWDFYCVMPDEPHVFKEELDFSAEVWKRMRELGVTE